jgi:hypothetical protein
MSEDVARKLELISEMSPEKLRAYVARAKEDSVAKINSDRTKSISRATGAAKASSKIPNGYLETVRAAIKANALAKATKSIVEDGEGVPANNVGGGAIAGVGVGSQGEPGVNRKKKPSVILGQAMRRRAAPSGN